MNVGFRIEYVDKYGCERVVYQVTREAAEAYAKLLWSKEGASRIRISDRPRSVAKVEA